MQLQETLISKPVSEMDSENQKAVNAISLEIDDADDDDDDGPGQLGGKKRRLQTSNNSAARLTYFEELNLFFSTGRDEDEGSDYDDGLSDFIVADPPSSTKPTKKVY